MQLEQQKILPLALSLQRFAREAGLTCSPLRPAQLFAGVIELQLRHRGPLIFTVGMYSGTRHIPDHAILVVGVDADNVFYDDPAAEKGKAKKEMSIADLKNIMSVWPCSILYLQ